MAYTRREFGRLATAALPAAYLVPAGLAAQDRPAAPDSRWAGVQIGLNVPYNFGGRMMPADEVLANTVALGISALELRAQPIEAFLGGPPTPNGGGQNASPAAVEAFAALRRWRASAPVAKAAELRRMYETAGVAIEIVKWDNVFGMSDDEVDYVFQVSKAAGARAVSMEIGTEDQTRRVGQFADRHELYVGYHGHAATGQAEYAAPLTSARFNAANVDIGHFVAGNHGSPVPFLIEHASRITHLHIKDRRRDGGPNVPFGQGDTPIREVLQLMRDRTFTFQATIEFEYPIPEGSSRMAEIAKAIAYCRECLLS